MTREEAMHILWDVKKLFLKIHSSHGYTTSKEAISVAFAVDKAIAVLHKREWIKTTDKVPFEEDAGDDGLVLTLTSSRNGKKWKLEGRHWKDLWKVNHPEYWAPLTISLPTLPKVEK